jgi:hypothetical protein
MWKLESMVVGMVGATVTSKLIRAAYRTIRKDKSPDAVFDPTSARFSWPDAVGWAAAAGVGLGIAKVMSARVAAIGWEVGTGTLPREPRSQRTADSSVVPSPYSTRQTNAELPIGIGRGQTFGHSQTRPYSAVGTRTARVVRVHDRRPPFARNDVPERRLARHRNPPLSA